jgi:hypothetical protein
MAGFPTILEQNIAVSGGEVSSLAYQFAVAQQAGNANLVLMVSADYPQVPVLSFGDTLNNKYNLIGSLSSPVATAQGWIYLATNIKAAAANANTLTVDFTSGSQYPEISCLQVSGADPNSPIALATIAFGAGGATSTLASAGPVTTGSTDNLGISYCFCGNSATGNGAGWTAFVNANTAGNGVSNDGYITQYEQFALAGASVTATTPLAEGTFLQILLCLQPPQPSKNVPLDSIFFGMNF